MEASWVLLESLDVLAGGVEHPPKNVAPATANAATAAKSL
jgi:hypothetical protein